MYVFITFTWFSFYGRSWAIITFTTRGCPAMKNMMLCIHFLVVPCVFIELICLCECVNQHPSFCIVRWVGVPLHFHLFLSMWLHNFILLFSLTVLFLSGTVLHPHHTYFLSRVPRDARCSTHNHELQFPYKSEMHRMLRNIPILHTQQGSYNIEKITFQLTF